MKKKKYIPPRFEPEYSLDSWATVFRFAKIARAARAILVTRQGHSPYIVNSSEVFRFVTIQGGLIGGISL